MTRLMDASAAAIFLLGMLTAQLVGPLEPAVAQTTVETISPDFRLRPSADCWLARHSSTFGKPTGHDVAHVGPGN